MRLEFGTGGLECTKALLTTSDVNRADWQLGLRGADLIKSNRWLNRR